VRIQHREWQRLEGRVFLEHARIDIEQPMCVTARVRAASSRARMRCACAGSLYRWRSTSRRTARTRLPTRASSTACGATRPRLRRLRREVVLQVRMCDRISAQRARGHNVRSCRHDVSARQHRVRLAQRVRRRVGDRRRRAVCVSCAAHVRECYVTLVRVSWLTLSVCAQ
jgi:hypothetical protein